MPLPLQRMFDPRAFPAPRKALGFRGGKSPPNGYELLPLALRLPATIAPQEKGSCTPDAIKTSMRESAGT